MAGNWLLQPIAGRRFATVAAVLGQLLFQFLNPGFQLANQRYQLFKRRHNRFFSLAVEGTNFF